MAGKVSGVGGLNSGRSLGIAGVKSDGVESVLSRCPWNLYATLSVVRKDGGQMVVKVRRLHTCSVSETCKTRGT